MKHKYLKNLLLLIVFSCLNLAVDARPRGGNSPFLAGAEIKLKPIGGDWVQFELIYYRDCSASPGKGGKNSKQGDPALVIFQSQECCEIIIDTAYLDTTLSERNATPLCPYNPAGTKCDSANSPNTGYKTETYVGTVKLSCKACDWRVGHMFSGTLAWQNFLLPTDIPPGWGPISMQLPNPPLHPINSFICRMQGGNTLSQQNDPTEGGFYIEAKQYCNKVDDGEDQTVSPPVKKYKANTTPRSAANPLIFQCQNVQRIYDLGYFDVDGHKLRFHKMKPYKDAPSSFSGFAVPLTYTGIFSEEFPLGSNSIYDLDTNTGILTINSASPPGFYKTAIKIQELDDNDNIIGETMRDVVITIINTPNCGDVNSVASVGKFLPGFTDLVNCGVVTNRINTIEACAGTSIEFTSKAMSTSPYPNASLVISAEFSPELEAIGALVTSTYVNNIFPKFDTAKGKVSITFPPNFPAGTYYAVLQIRDCIDGFILSRTEVVNIRVNAPTKLNWSYLNTKINSNTIVLPTRKRAFTCSGAPTIVLEGDNGQKDASFMWEFAGVNNYTLFNNGNRNNANCVVDPGEVGKVVVISNQYCNNRDTVDIISKPDLTVSLDTIVKRGNKLDKSTICYSDTVDFKVLPQINGYLYDWTYTTSPYTEIPISISNTTTSLLKNPSNYYTVYVISPDSCVVPFTRHFDVVGVRPTSSFTSDKKFVCPLDTIQVFPFYTTALCGDDKFSKVKGSLLVSNYPGNQSNTSATPKIFAASDTIINMKTQFLYKAEELIKNDFKPGVVRMIRIHLQGITSPTDYSNLKLKVACTDRTDLENLVFSDLDKNKLLASYPVFSLDTGWNEFNLGGGFSWDGLTNLIFQVEASCVKPNPGSQSLPPAFSDNLTNYISLIGKYGINLSKFETNPVVGTNYRPNISFKYYEFDNNRMTFKWTDTFKKQTVSNKNIPNPKIYTAKNSWYYVEVRDSLCTRYDSVLADVNEEYKIIMRDSVSKCPGDTVQLIAQPGMVSRRPFNYFCGVDNRNDIYKLYGFNKKSEDTCRVVDTIYYPYFGNPTSATAEGTVSPFGGSTTTAGSASTDKRLQLIYTAAELKALTGMKKGIIREIRMDVLTKFVNTDNISNFSIKMKCIPDTVDIFYPNNKFDNLATFKEVYSASTYNTVVGPNIFTLNEPFGWDGTTGIMIDICFDNITGTPYYSDIVRTFNTVGKNRALYKVTNTATSAVDPDYGCMFSTGTRSTYRPNLGFTICSPTTPYPPIPKFFNWVPPTYISNTQINNPIVYNESTTKFYVNLDYVDTNLNKSINICRVGDTFLSKVGRPKIEFLPKDVVSCANKPVDVKATIDGFPSSLYDFKWNASLGLDPNNLDNPKQTVQPPNPKYYYVRVSKLSNPNCWSLDSIFVGIQQLSAMPDLGGAVLLCKGDSALLSIPTGVGYKNPVWLYNGNPLDTGYTIKVGKDGAYSTLVDSGACRNASALKYVTYRTPVEATLLQKDFKVCKGDTAVIVYNLGNGVTVPLWNNGVLNVVNKVTENGQYFLIKAKDQYGCDMKVRDTAIVDVVSNPDFVIQNDTICLGINQKTKLIPDPLDPSATYSWEPTGETTSSIDVVKPGTYTVTRTNLNCVKKASAVVIEEKYGTLDLGKNQAICCDEILTLDANPTGKKYKTYKWSTGATSQVIYTLPNASGTYVVEAIKPSGCKDTGSVYIDSKCADVKAKVEKEKIQLGETNQIVTTHLDIKASNIIYKWVPSQEYNKIINGDKMNPIAKPKDTGDAEYVLVMTVIDSTYMPPKPYCVENTVVRFKVKPNGLNTNNVFSPNKDGVNDDFYPVITGNVNVKEYKVYNRQGLLVHNDVNRPWDGNYNGSPQPSGVYVCLITYEIVEPMKDPEIKHEEINLVLIR